MSCAHVALAPPTWLWQIGSPVACCSVACADAALSGTGFGSLAGPGLARSPHCVLPFRGMAKQILAQRLSQISTRASSLTVWAGLVRSAVPAACLTEGSSVYSVYSEALAWDSVLRQAVWDLGPHIEAACHRSSAPIVKTGASEFFRG